MIASAMPSLPPAGGAYQYDVDAHSTPLKRKWSGQRLDSVIDPEGHMQENAKHARQELHHGASTRRKESGREHSRGRQNSLRRVKNSKEMMRQRSMNRDNQEVAPDGTSGGREGRQFTVANVGNNGRIYLRYVSFFFRYAVLSQCQSLPGK